ncbi:MAG: acyl-CoA dehydrogenase family protein [Pseudomonadota bacterium]
MAFSFTDEQEAFREVVQRFLGDHSSTADVRRMMETDTGFDADVWRQLAGELGLTGLVVPEEFGGQGFGDVELGIVMEEMGRALLCAPFFSSAVLATLALLESGTDAARQHYLPRLASGELRATLAVAEDGGSWDPADVQMIAADGALTGQKRFVVDGNSAEVIFVAARNGAGGDVGLYAVDANAAGLERRALNVVDPTRKLAELQFAATPATLVSGPDARDGLVTALRRAAIALANESAGGAQAMLQSAVDYTLMRVQFGRLIGSFQAIKHQCAELLLEVELAKSAAYHAASAAAERDDELPALASAAKAGTSDSFMRAAIACIQLHGGIGFTWEQDTHLWFKRAKSSEVMLGTPAYHRELMMQHWA